MKKNYIFDFGNVLGEFYPERLTAPFVEEEILRKEISDVVFDRLYWDRLDDGSITDDQVREGIRSRLPEKHGDVACKVYDNWARSMTPLPGMEKLVEDAKNSGKRLFLLSNISVGFAESYRDIQWIARLFSHFDGLVFSGVIKKVKPTAEIFEYVLNEFGLNADECLFIDDSEKNIRGAESAGIEGYLFDGDAQKLREFLDL